jgi:hypothetical protein
MPDGAHLMVTDSFVADRLKRVYKGNPIEPDVPTGSDADEVAAKWIEQQCR